jgi:hypothetical protein
VGRDEMRRLLEEELERESPPPMGDLVLRSVRRGRQLRRTRTILTVTGSGLALAGLLAGVFAIAGAVPHHSTGPTVGFGAPQASGAGTVSEATTSAETGTATPTPGPPAQAGAGGPKTKATTRGMLELLSLLMPAGKQSAAAAATDGSLFVALNIDRGQGPGMVRVSVTPMKSPAPGPSCHQRATCRGLPDGSTLEILDLPDNCIERHAVYLYRPDGIIVGILTSSCLSWNGKTNPPSPVVLSIDEATAIARDPRWGTEMPRSLVEAGIGDFPHPSTFG